MSEWLQEQLTMLGKNTTAVPAYKAKGGGVRGCNTCIQATGQAPYADRLPWLP